MTQSSLWRKKLWASSQKRNDEIQIFNGEPKRIQTWEDVYSVRSIQKRIS